MRLVCGACLLLCWTIRADTITIAGPGLTLVFDNRDGRLALSGMNKPGFGPLVYRDRETSQPGSGPVGNPFAVVIRKGPHRGVWFPRDFRVTSLRNDDHSLTAYLAHDTLPLLLALQVSVEGSVATWRGQAFWNGQDSVELDIYLPLLSRIRFESLAKDRLLAAEVSGIVLNSIGGVNYSDAYTGSLSAPVFLVEGGGHGIAVIDDNRAEWAEDPGACALRGQVVGNKFPVSEMTWSDSPRAVGGNDGPFIGIRYTRRFRSIDQAGGEAEYRGAEQTPQPLPVRKLGDSIDIGPVRMYAYSGSWRQGAVWIRKQRADLPFRVSPAGWYRNTTFVAEAMGDVMVRAGNSFYDYPKVLAAKQRMGADLFTIPGFHDPEILGTAYNFLNRGDYVFAAENLGGFEAARAGIDALHKQNGHILYYIEGLIVWKRSRIGRAWAKDWALMNEDGSYVEDYKGFYHMCPAVPEWQDWFAKTAAEIVRTTGVDGFFIDSLLATNNHRCFNPAHHHPHPDVWTWGVRQTLRRMREEVDKVNPETVLFTEGEADLGREFVDGFISHSSFWNQGHFTEPLLRFIYPDMRAFESWGYGKQPQRSHVFNSVTGHRIYAHNSSTEIMAALSLGTRRYYDLYPEIADAQMSAREIICDGCIANLFEGARSVLTAGNPSAAPAEVTIGIPTGDTCLFDRTSGARIGVADGRARVALGPWEFRAFELRP